MTYIAYIKNEIRISGFGSVFYYEHGKDFYHPPERHGTWEMVFVDRGKILAITEGVGCKLDEGKAIFHEPYEIHTHISNGKESNNMFVVSFLSDSPAMDFFKKKIFTLDKTSKKLLSLFLQESKNALGKIQGDYLNRTPLNFENEKFGSTQLMASYFEEFLIRLIRSGGEKVSFNNESRLIARNSVAELVEDYLRQNIYANLTMTDICKHFYIGKSQLSVIFKDYTGKSLISYYSDLKIAEAKKLLRDDKMSVVEVAEALGYSGIHSFSRSFKNATGFAPTKYKESIY